jgi:hypothetical protein
LLSFFFWHYFSWVIWFYDLKKIFKMTFKTKNYNFIFLLEKWFISYVIRLTSKLIQNVYIDSHSLDIKIKSHKKNSKSLAIIFFNIHILKKNQIFQNNITKWLISIYSSITAKMCSILTITRVFFSEINWWAEERSDKNFLLDIK